MGFYYGIVPFLLGENGFPKIYCLGGVSDFPQSGEGRMIRTLERILPEGYE